MQIFLACPRGFCAGVTRAVSIVERALIVHGAPIYVRHEIVHNKTVVETLKNRGAIFVESLTDIPPESTVVFSAHGVPKSVETYAKSRKDLTVYDATCPLVTKVHREVAKMHEAGYTIIMIGHAGHPEVEGTMGQIEGGMLLVQNVADVEKLPNPCGPVAYVTQTTISVDDAKAVIEALKKRFPDIKEPKKADVCYATQNRQDAVRDLAKYASVTLVIGSVTSSNSNRLREMSERQGARAYLIDSFRDINPIWFAGVDSIGITAGASAPEELVQGVLEYLKNLYPDCTITPLGGKDENVSFPMPKGLWLSDIEE